MRLALSAVFLAGPLLAAASASAEEPTREQQVKAAFLYNFLQFVEWPADAFKSPNSPYVIGVLGADDPLRGAMDSAVAGKQVASHAVVVRHFASADEVATCHVLYVADAGARDVARSLEKLRGFGGPGGRRRGRHRRRRVLDFFTEDGRIRLEISQRAAERARLHVSSRLLKICKPRDGQS